MPPQASDPAVDPARIEELYAALKVMQVELDADPLELGPKRLNEKIAICRGLLSRCETMFLSVSQDLHRYKRSLRSATADFKLRMRELLSNDPEVRMGRNVTDREAIASNRLRTEQEEIDRLTACVEDLDAVLTVVRTKRADLKDIQGRLRDQLKVCQEEIGLGGRWGRSVPSSRRPPDPAQREVNDLIDNVVKTMEEDRKEDRKETTTSNESSLQAEFPLIEFLGEPSPPTDKEEEILPEEGSVPVVPHPDSNVFTDDGVDELLSRL